jgi:stage V sporulation protein G
LACFAACATRVERLAVLRPERWGRHTQFEAAGEKARIGRRSAVEITEVRIKLMDEPGERLKAFCSITFDDCFVVRDLKIIEGTNGAFVAMPSRKLTAHCPACRTKNHLRAVHCNQCGARLREPPVVREDEGRAKLYADIAHPINSACREMIQQRVIRAFDEEKVRAQQPGYVSRYDDLDAEEFETAEPPRGESPPPESPRAAPSRPSAAKVEDAEPPRGPHQPPKPGQSAQPPQRDFGAGIFD